jgi:hypothetical protein
VAPASGFTMVRTMKVPHPGTGLTEADWTGLLAGLECLPEGRARGSAPSGP